jgi:outer membrane protein insertion porin family
LQRYSATFREPFLFDRPYSLTTQAYYYNRIYNEYTETRVGGAFSLGHMLTRNWSITGGLRLEDVDVSNVSFFAPQDYTSIIGSHFVAAPSIATAWDTRDSFMRPTEGGLVKFQYEQAFGSFTYPIFNVEASRYFTTYQRPDGSGRHVLVAYSHVGWAGTETPAYDRFFAGGFNSIRGFQFRGVGPNINGFEVGGDFLFLNGLEYQIPVRANDQLYLVGFVDSGTVESRIGIHDYRVSTGVGLRITVPIMGPVPIAIDFGIPIVRGPGDRTQLVAFWVGLFR